jgi:nucleotide-binding universal stress UspA family protein
MMRRLLVAMDGSAHAEAAATQAIAWGRRFGCTLVGLGVLDTPAIEGAEPVPLGASYYKHQRDIARTVDAERRIAKFLGDFRGRCQKADVACTIVEDVGTPHEQIVLEAASCDAVMLGTETNFHFATQHVPDDTLSRVLRGSPRPVVVMPRAPIEGEGVLVAYGGGQQVARALQTFTLLGLADDEIVVVFAVDRDGGRADERLHRAGDYLAAHEVAYRLHPLITDNPPAEVIVEELRRQRPRMLVIGAPGHHPVRDLFSTSVTRAVLAATGVPVFVSS